jgi:Reverse transcriptase (RNA-dependent DNA polymerase)
VDNIIIVVLVYVDDIIIIGNNLDEIRKVKTKLRELFDIKDLGLMKYFFKDKNCTFTKRTLCISKKVYS